MNLAGSFRSLVFSVVSKSSVRIFNAQIFITDIIHINIKSFWISLFCVLYGVERKSLFLITSHRTTWQTERSGYTHITASQNEKDFTIKQRWKRAGEENAKRRSETTGQFLHSSYIYLYDMQLKRSLCRIHNHIFKIKSVIKIFERVWLWVSVCVCIASQTVKLFSSS